MSFLDYLKSRILPLLIVLGGISLIALILWIFDTSPAAIIGCSLLLVLAVGSACIWDYLSKRRYYTQLKSALNAESEALYSIELMDRPSFYEGQLTYDTIERATKHMNDRIAEYRLASEEYREFIESWIHEIKTPIAAAELAVENARAQTETSLGTSLAFDLDRINSYVEQALYYSRSTAVEKDYLIKAVELAPLVQGVVKKQSRALIGAGIMPLFEGLDHKVYGDAKWLDFILNQIVENAIKYRRPKSADHTPHLVFKACKKESAGSSAQSIQLDITDNGIGIPTTDISRIFEKGFTGENGRRYTRSTGIGLYLAKKLCTKMKLSITATSLPGKATTLSITFPLSKMYFLD